MKRTLKKKNNKKWKTFSLTEENDLHYIIKGKLYLFSLNGEPQHLIAPSYYVNCLNVDFSSLS